MLHHHELDTGFAALADPTRRAIVQRLTHSPASAGELTEPFDMSLTATLQHIKVLEDAGIVVTEKQGRRRICQLAPDQLRHLARWLEQQRTAWEHRLDRLGDVLDDDTDEETTT